MEQFDGWLEPNESWLDLNGSWSKDPWIPDWCREQDLELELERNRTIWLKDIINGSFVEQSILFPICSFGVLGQPCKPNIKKYKNFPNQAYFQRILKNKYDILNNRGTKYKKILKNIFNVNEKRLTNIH